MRGQPNLNFTVDRKQAARYQINVADVQDAIQTTVGGNALTQVLQGERRFDVVMRYLRQYRDTREAIALARIGGLLALLVTHTNFSVVVGCRLSGCLECPCRRV